MPTTKPSPHTGSQVVRPHAGVLQSHPCSSEHTPEHPSSFAVLLSSHASSDAKRPSPQLDLHTLGSAVPQSKPHSTEHVDEHPSPLSVPRSSHCSMPTTIPSPHVGLHVVKPQADVMQSNPCSREQTLLQPSLFTRLLSSHASSRAWAPSPQLDVHALGSSVPQSKPHSTVHVDEHPSPDRESPLSHSSFNDTRPFPHTSVQFEFLHGVVEHSQPCSNEQRPLHPSALAVLLSSQPSSDARIPSPQVDVQSLG